MSIHFAPAPYPGRAPVCYPIARAMIARAVERVANDNCDGGWLTEETAALSPSDSIRGRSDLLLHAALRHFSDHGLGAARAARAQAEAAFFAGDRQSYDWWLGITRTLDRRLAAEAQRLEPMSS